MTQQNLDFQLCRYMYLKLHYVRFFPLKLKEAEKNIWCACAAASHLVKPEMVILRVRFLRGFSDQFIRLYLLTSHTQSKIEGPTRCLGFKCKINITFMKMWWQQWIIHLHHVKTKPSPSFEFEFSFSVHAIVRFIRS